MVAYFRFLSKRKRQVYWKVFQTVRIECERASGLNMYEILKELKELDVKKGT